MTQEDSSYASTAGAWGESQSGSRGGKSFIRQLSRSQSTLSYVESPNDEKSFFDLVIGPFLVALLCSVCFLALCIYLSEHGAFLTESALPMEGVYPPDL